MLYFLLQIQYYNFHIPECLNKKLLSVSGILSSNEYRVLHFSTHNLILY